MPLKVNKSGNVVFVPKPVGVGSKYERRTIQFFDGRCGTYWEANHIAVDPDEQRIQKALTKKPKKIKVKVRFTYDESVQAILRTQA